MSDEPRDLAKDLERLKAIAKEQLMEAGRELSRVADEVEKHAPEIEAKVRRFEEAAARTVDGLVKRVAEELEKKRNKKPDSAL